MHNQQAESRENGRADFHSTVAKSLSRTHDEWTKMWLEELRLQDQHMAEMTGKPWSMRSD